MKRFCALITVMLAATVGCAKKDVDDDSDDTNEFVVGYETHDAFGDPVLLSASTVDGDVIDFIGTRDGSGLPVTTTGYAVTFADGRDVMIQVDASGRPTRLDLDDGTTFRMEWVSDSQVVFTTIADNGSTQVTTSVDLAQSAPASETQSVESPWKTYNLAGQVVVGVNACGAPVDDAIVKIRGFIDGRRYFDFKSSSDGSGQYAFTMPSQDTTIGADLTSVCSSLNMALGFVAKGAEAVGEGGQAVFCAQLATAAATALPPGAPVTGPTLFAACEVALKGVVIADKVLNCPVEGPDCLGALICSKLKGSVTFSGGADYDLYALAYNGDRNIESAHQTGDSAAGWPDFSLDFGGSTAIDSFTTSPADPGPGEGYTASAAVSCAATDSNVSMSVTGTDGFTSSTSQLITGDGSISLDVPGGAAGVQDTVNVAVPNGPTKTIALVF